MNLTPQRKHAESFEAYRERRKAENKAVENYLRGGASSSSAKRHKYGKAETKRRKRARRETRRAKVIA